MFNLSSDSSDFSSSIDIRNFYFLIQDSSLNIASIVLKVYQHVYKKIFNIGPSLICMSKNGKI